jgi:AraC-like DNA-binding protein
VPPKHRASYWSEIYQRCVSPIAFHPADREEFEAELRVGDLGLIKFAAVSFGKSAIERTPAHVRNVSDRILSFLMIVRGGGVITHHGRESDFSPGDTILIDNTNTSLCRYMAPAEVIVVRAPEDVIRIRMNRIDGAVGRLLPRGSGLADTAFVMTQSLSECCLGRGLPARYGPEVSGQLLDVLTTAYSIAVGGDAPEAPLRAARASAAREHIEANLADPLLSPRRVAAALRLSSRYLRDVMADEGECLSTYILRRRLEECSKRLASASSRVRTITDIAFSCGFNNAAHFTRVFKAKYGLSPRDYRKLHADD